MTSSATAAAFALGGGYTAGIALSGGGADSQNVIDADVNAFVDSSVLDSAAGVTVTAENASTIDASVGAVATSVAIGGTAAGVGASIGVSLAHNEIGSSGDPSLVQAFIRSSSVHAADALDITATSSQAITASSEAISVAMSGGLYAGVAASGAGTDVQNDIRSHVKAFIDGSGATGMETESVGISASDTSVIRSSALAAAVGGAVGAVGGSAAVGVSLAKNRIENEVEALISGASDIATTGGDISLSATEDAEITAEARAAAIATSGGSVSLSFSGGGAEATNVILSTTNAHVDDSTLVSVGDVVVTAANDSEIHADVLGISGSASYGGPAGVAVSIGVALARNLIGSEVADTVVADYTTDETADITLSVGKTVRIARRAR